MYLFSKFFYVEERLICLKIIQSIVYAKNSIHHDELYKKIKVMDIKSVIDCFNKNCHSTEYNGLYISNQHLYKIGIILLYDNTVRFGFRLSYVLVTLLF